MGLRALFDRWRRVVRSREATAHSELEIRARILVDSMRAGAAPSSRRGSGIEPDTIRRYEAGDDMRAIDWRVTAKRGELHVRQFEEEQDLDVLFALDASPSLIGTDFGFAAEAARDAVAALSLAAVEAGHRVGLLVHTHRVEAMVRPARKRAQWRLLLGSLGAGSWHAGSDMEAMVLGARRLLRSRSLVVLVSDFLASGALDDRSPEIGALAGLASGHDVVPLVIRVPGVADLPDIGTVRVRDPRSGQTVLLDTGLRPAGPDGHQLALERLRRLGLGPLPLDPRLPLAPQLRLRFGRVRRRAA